MIFVFAVVVCVYVSPVPPFEFTSKSNKEQFMREVKRCMEVGNRTYAPTNTAEARAHFEQLKNESAQYWNVYRHPYGRCYGPFMEHEYIRRYKDRPLADFEPFIPLFVPWLAMLGTLPRPEFKKAVWTILNMTRPEYLYLIVSESDFGFLGTTHEMVSLHNSENFFILSAGGMGHVAIPWNHCNATAFESRSDKYFLTFCGNPRSSWQRKDLMEIAVSVFGSDLHTCRTSKWRDTIAESRFCFSPRGIAVSTYRTFELLRLECIPVITTDRYHWLPYHPALNWSEFSVITDAANLPKTYIKLKTMDDSEIARMREALHRASLEFFQWDGFFNHFDMFLSGTGRSYFTCSKAFLTS